MTLVAVIVVLAVLGVVAALVTGAVRGDMAEPTSSLPPSGVPEGELVPQDLQAVRFSLGFRGYRMDEVDEVLDRVAVELVRRDAEIERLRGQLGRAASAAGTSAGRSENGVAGLGLGQEAEHHGRHLRPEPTGDEPPRGADESVDQHRTDQHRADEHRVDEHRVDEHRVDEHRVDEHRPDEHRTGQPSANGATAASVAPASARPPEWSGSDGA